MLIHLQRAEQLDAVARSSVPIPSYFQIKHQGSVDTYTHQVICNSITLLPNIKFHATFEENGHKHVQD